MSDEFEDEYERDEVSKVDENRNSCGKLRGLPKTGGRKAGTPNKATAAIKELASEYGPDAIECLAAVMYDESESTTNRMRAAETLLDRGYGKPTVAIEKTEVDDFPIPSISEIWPSLTQGSCKCQQS